MSIKVGSKVVCRLFNKPERRYYGPEFTGVVIAVDFSDKPYTIKRDSGLPDIALHRNEVKAA